MRGLGLRKRRISTALIAAEEPGVTAANADERKGSSKDPEMRRMLGADGELGKLLGFDKEWAYNVIKAVGNYGEIYDRKIGPKGVVPIPCDGLNRLWGKGGAGEPRGNGPFYVENGRWRTIADG